MDWKVFFGTILTSLASAGGAYALVFRHLLARDLESYKHKLKAESDRAIEQIKTDLHIRALEHEIRFRTLHEKQAKIISTVYNRLYDLDLALRNYADPVHNQDKTTCLKACESAHQKFSKLFFPRRLFFPRDTSKKIELIHKKLLDLTDNFTKGRQEMEKPFWAETLDNIALLRPVLDDLEQDFQKLLGLDQPTAPKKAPGSTD